LYKIGFAKFLCSNFMQFLYAWQANIIVQSVDFPDCDGSPCQQMCVETDESFQCSCTNGYLLASDNRRCIGMYVHVSILNTMTLHVVAMP